MKNKKYLIRETLIDRFIQAFFGAVATGKEEALRKRLGGDTEFDKAIKDAKKTKDNIRALIAQNRKDPKFRAEYSKSLKQMGLDPKEYLDTLE